MKMKIFVEKLFMEELGEHVLNCNIQYARS